VDCGGEFMAQPPVFWKEAMRFVCHGMGASMLRQKPLRELVGRLQRKRPGWLQVWTTIVAMLLLTALLTALTCA
jgi:hypothetical protein